MPYYIVKRTRKIIEDVIVSAETKGGAFNKAGLDVKCRVISHQEEDFQPVFDSVAEIAYVSEHTRKEIED